MSTQDDELSNDDPFKNFGEGANNTGSSTETGEDPLAAVLRSNSPNFDVNNLEQPGPNEVFIFIQNAITSSFVFSRLRRMNGKSWTCPTMNPLS
jgi:hypothetical protein